MDKQKVERARCVCRVEKYLYRNTVEFYVEHFLLKYHNLEIYS